GLLMPLLDHSLPIVEQRGPWATFHSFWCCTIVAQTNQLLPAPRFYGLVHVRAGWRVEGEVSESDPEAFEVACPPWKPTATLDTVFPSNVEVHVMDADRGPEPAAVVALATPDNKRGGAARRAFAAKCAAYLQRGVGLAIVDVAPHGRCNLHNELMDLL